MEEAVTRFECPQCGQSIKSEAGLAAHVRFKHPTEEASAKAPVTSGQPAILPGNRRVQGRALGLGHRSISMLRPKCDICQNGDNVPPRWYLDCPHDPYMTIIEREVKVPHYEDELVNGSPTGRKVLKGTDTVLEFSTRPNWVEISVSTRINNGQGANYARGKGFIRPSELRNELYPFGIAECCEWADCKWQQDLVTYRDGVFCREIEAQYASIDIRGTGGGKHNLEIGHDQRSREIREAQLQGAVIR